MANGEAFSIPHHDLVDRSIDELAADLADGRMSARELTHAYIDRIEATNDSGPCLRAVNDINPDALDIADQLDSERRSGDVRGPLHGIPILIKENIDTADRMPTTAGSLALLDLAKPQDAGVAEKLRNAGAVILGKTNLSEFANFRSTRSSSGWSGRGGQCVNPYQLDRSPSGSSSGSGVAASASLAAGTLGTETDGSIVSPANASGVVGMKPTVGLTSRAGVIPIAASQDSIGPMCRTVADAAVLLAAIAGADARDQATLDAPAIDWDLTKILDPGGLNGARIGVAREVYWGFHPDVEALAEQALVALREAGAEIVDPANIPTAKEIAGGWPPAPDNSRRTVLQFEFKAGLNAYLSERSGSIRTLSDLIAWNAAHPDLEMPWFGQELLEQSDACGPLTDANYLKAIARNHRLSREEGIDAALREHRLDAIVAPTGAPAWKIDLLNGGGGTRGGCSTPPAMAGYPVITVPMGAIHGMPVGFSFIGTAWSDAKLLRLAYAFEQATNARIVPGFTPAGVMPPE